jgi:tetratricopeptide (TPR) repeat protein
VLNRVLALRPRLGEHRQVATALQRLGNLYYQRGECLSIWQRLHGPEDAKALDTMGNLGIALAEQKRLAEAEKMLQDTLALQKKPLGAESSEAARTLLSLSSMHLNHWGRSGRGRTLRPRVSGDPEPARTQTQGRRRRHAKRGSRLASAKPPGRS